MASPRANSPPRRNSVKYADAPRAARAAASHRSWPSAHTPVNGDPPALRHCRSVAPSSRAAFTWSCPAPATHARNSMADAAARERVRRGGRGAEPAGGRQTLGGGRRGGDVPALHEPQPAVRGHGPEPVVTRVGARLEYPFQPVPALAGLAAGVPQVVER